MSRYTRLKSLPSELLAAAGGQFCLGAESGSEESADVAGADVASDGVLIDAAVVSSFEAELAFAEIDGGQLAARAAGQAARAPVEGSSTREDAHVQRGFEVGEEFFVGEAAEGIY